MGNEGELTDILYDHLKPPLNKDIDFVKERISMTLSSLQNLQTTLEWCNMKYDIMGNEGELTDILYDHLKPPPNKDIDFVKKWISTTISSFWDLQTTSE